MIKLSWAPGVNYKCNLLLYINYTHVVHMLQNIQTILIQFQLLKIIGITQSPGKVLEAYHWIFLKSHRLA